MMDKRVILALVLSLFILIGYQAIVARFYPQQFSPATSRSAAIPKKIINNEEPRPEIAPETAPAFIDEKEVIFQNDLYTVLFTDFGAGIKRITLNKNPRCGLNINYDMFNSTDPRHKLCLFFPDGFGAVLNNVKYSAARIENGVIFTHNFKDDFIVEKKFLFHNSLYLIELELGFRNLKAEVLTKKYSLISTVHLTSSHADERLFGISADLDGKIWRYKKRSRPFDEIKTGVPGWVMVKDRYFSMITRPFATSSGYFVSQNQDGAIFAGLNVKEFEIYPNSGTNHKFGIYAGPSDLNLIKEVNIGVDNALNYGFFGSISQILVGSLKLFHKVTKNWGVSIILLAVFMNLLLLPLTKKSYKSIQEMQMLQPKIEKIRQECKDNPQKLQKEIMELYKRHKINPMGGCLPLVLQMPIFFALYQGLMGSLDLKGAGFLWIQDLSMPENIKLPFSIPLLGNSMKILPILMIVGMFFQQQFSNKVTSMTQTDEQRKQQKFMTVFMTLFFGFIFYNFPSGLVLYWLVNTVIMTAYQFSMMRKPRQMEVYA